MHACSLGWMLFFNCFLSRRRTRHLDAQSQLRTGLYNLNCCLKQCVNILILINFHRYTIMLNTVDSSNPKKVTGLETRHGYFKLNVKKSTKLDLKCYEKSRVKWLYFTAIKPQNPQHRAWLHAIRGPAFLPAHLHCKFTVDTIKVR